MDAQRALGDAAARLAALQRVQPAASAHRALRRVRVGPRRLASTLAVAAASVLLLLALQPPLLAFWAQDLLFWGSAIELRADGSIGAPQGHLPAPQATEFAAVAAATLAAYAATLVPRDPLTPLKYLLRLLCLVQATALLFFAMAAPRFPYTLAWHLEAVLASGRGVMFAAAVLMPLVEGALGVPAGRRIAHVGLLLAYFALAVPQQVLLHAWLLQRVSVLLMPLLHLAFGALLDVVLLVALLSWMLSEVDIAAAT